MLISLNWIKEFTNLPELSPKEISSRFTLATAEVEDIIVKNDFLKKVLLVEVKSMRPHPDSDKLNLVTIDYGTPDYKEIVCGAQNVAVGLKVPYAQTGTTLPNGMTLEPKKIRGILSEGMLCSEVELGISNESAGLMILDTEGRPGMTMAEYLKADTDVLLDVDNKSLTHRPDLWGHLGLAREFAAAFGLPLNNPYNDTWMKKMEGMLSNTPSPIKIQVDENSSCHTYLGLSLSNIKVGETPSYIKNRLEAVGMRSINSIVDISNYVMVELGLPNHIFDRDKIAGDTLFIKKLSGDSEFVTLDEQTRKLNSSDTVIADKEKTLVLAGLMGGSDAGVDEGTKNIFIEVANWEATEVRKTSVRLGLRTDSSQRFEKTLDSNLCYRTLLRLVEVIKEICPEAKIEGSVEKFAKKSKFSQEITFNISQDLINSRLGMEIDSSRIENIFKSLDFKTTLINGVFTVIVPTYRTTKDISCEADLVEEIGRMIGYDNIVPVSPVMDIKPIRLSATKKFHRKIQDFMVLHAKSLQVMTYPLIGKDLLDRAMWTQSNEELVLVNALSVDHDRMRPSLIPHAIEMSAINQKSFDQFSFFELGRSYQGYENERSQLLIGLYSKKKTRFVELENILEKLFSTLNITFNFAGPSTKFKNDLMPEAWKGVHPHEFQNIQVMGKFLGAMTTVHPMVLKNFKMKGYLTLAVIDLTDLEAREQKDKVKYSPIAKFPSASCDFTVVMKKDVAAAEVLSSLKSLKIKELREKSIVDVFTLNDDEKTVSIRTTFSHNEKTLTAEEIKNCEKEVVQVLEKAGFFLKK